MATRNPGTRRSLTGPIDRPRAARGFTIVELLVVIAIIGILVPHWSCRRCSWPANRLAVRSAPTI